MSIRPYLQKSAAELEAIFKLEGDTPAVLKNLKHELSFRTTKAAGRLAKRVAASLDAQNNSTGPTVARGHTVAQAQAPRPNVSQPGQGTLPFNNPTPPVPEQQPVLMPPEDANNSVAPALHSRIKAPRPEICDRPQDILQAWTALEVLSPMSVRNWSSLNVKGTRQIVSINGPDLPWKGGAKARPGKKVVFEVFLGSVGLEDAFNSILKVYADTRPERQSRSGRAILASVIVDKNGCPLDEDETLGISSFGWGVPVAMGGNLTALGQWPSVERALLEGLQKQLIRRDDDGAILPLDRPTIDRAYQYLVKGLNLNGLDIEGPEYALRRYEYFASKQAPEPSILNSFYLADLERARALFSEGKSPHNLQLYLGQKPPAQRSDLLNDDPSLFELLRPANTPLGRWPAPGRHPLVLLQQAAVNATVRDLKTSGILAVNGPPGTGKTTLLRDVAVARIVERAEAMSKLSDPAASFRKTGHTVQRQGSKINIFSVDPALRGFEMVVASSNNKAVENVSAELPGIDAIASDADSLRFFKSISDKVLGRETWGAIAAVLGNSKNRYEFAETYWRDQEHGMQTYLNNAAGIPQYEAIKHDDGSIEYRTRAVVTVENAPKDRFEARRRWATARAAFTNALDASRKVTAEFDEMHKALMAPDDTKIRLRNASHLLASTRDQLAESALAQSTAAKSIAISTAHIADLEQRHAVLMANKPKILSRLFRSKDASNWQQITNALSSEKASSREELAQLTGKHGTASNDITRLRRAQSDHEAQVAQLEAEELRLRTALARINQHNAPTPDGRFSSLGRNEKQLATLWFREQEQRLRDTVFEKAMALHRAFLDAAADPIRQNLALFFESFGTRSLGSPAMDQEIEELWATFFLAVPVVSTTFASVERMFSRLPVGALGWLLIDEAGQALPQAAVGALMRARRAV